MDRQPRIVHYYRFCLIVSNLPCPPLVKFDYGAGNVVRYGKPHELESYFIDYLSHKLNNGQHVRNFRILFDWITRSIVYAAGFNFLYYVRTYTSSVTLYPSTLIYSFLTSSIFFLIN